MTDRPTLTPARVATLAALPIALIAGLLVFWLLGGFDAGKPGGGPDAGQPDGRAASPSATPRAQSSAPVAMPAPSLDQRRATVCRALLSQLPDAVRELRRRPVTAGPEQNAAYGDPAITLACGVPAVSVEPTAIVFNLGPCWYADQRPDATVWTTVDREVPVRVTVPIGYAAPGQWVAAFSPPLVAAVPSAPTRPSGC